MSEWTPIYHSKEELETLRFEADLQLENFLASNAEYWTGPIAPEPDKPVIVEAPER